MTLTSTMAWWPRNMLRSSLPRQLAAAGLNLYYWSNDSTPSEIEFVIQYGGHATPVEVKSGTNVKGKSIARYVRNNPEIKGLRFSLLPYKQQEWLTNIPLYSVPFMSEFQLVDVGY